MKCVMPLAQASIDISIPVVAAGIVGWCVTSLRGDVELSPRQQHAVAFAAALAAAAVTVSLISSADLWGGRSPVLVALALTLAAGVLAAAVLWLPLLGIRAPQVSRRVRLALLFLPLIPLAAVTARALPASSREEVLPNVPAKEYYVYGTGATGFEGLNRREDPDRDAPTTGKMLHDGDPVWVKCQVAGEWYTPRGDSEAKRSNVWLRLKDGSYLISAFVSVEGGRRFNPQLPRCEELATEES